MKMRNLLLMLALFMQGSAYGSQPKVDWFEADKAAAVSLVRERRHIGDLVHNVMASKPKTPQEAMLKLNVLMRAGMNDAAAEAIEELGQLCPSLENHQISLVYHRACDQYEAWGLARRMLEVFAERVTNVWLENRLLKHWMESEGSFDEIDVWLAEMPAGRKGYWVKERVRFNEAHSRAEKLVRELAEKVRKNPEDIERALLFLDALIYARRGPLQEQDLSWLAAAIKPKLGTEAEAVASRLKILEQWEAASAFFRRAIEMPLTDGEVTDYGSQFQLFMSQDVLRAIFAVNAREGLAQCLMKMEKNAEAQKLMVAAADIREEHELGMNAFLAGEVQRESGARVIEGRIKEKEKLSEDDLEYWRKRAQYYRGRGEADKEEEALVKALSLTRPLPLPERPSKVYADLRSWALSDYALFLKRMKRVPEAIALLRTELTETPAISVSSWRAAGYLAFDFEKHISVDDDLLWKWLSERPKWEHTEKRLLWRMLENARRPEIPDYFSRAEKLTKDKDPTRALSLGWIMNRMEYPKRSILLLEYAFEAASDEKLKEEAAMTLFESFLDVGDWSRAEKIYPQARKRLSVSEETDWYTRIAVAAAASGEKDEAMRIWLVAANANPARPLWLRQLTKYGLKDDLKAFYRDLAKRLPESDAPAKALKILQEQK
ncbi:MAG: hypothetical protein ACYSU3_09290 [Planctomycetota bacterium]|jgi:tetratricopeptide (TPR) repeat protein